MSGLEAKRDELTRRYGGVLFDLAQANKELDKVTKDVTRLYRSLQEEPQGWAQIVSPSTPLHTQRLLVKELAVSLKLGSLMKRFLLVLCQNRRLQKLKSIFEEFFAQVQTSEGLLQGTLETATKLSKKDVESLQKSLTQKLGKNILLRQEIKESLLAGVVLRIGSLMVDVSLGTQLNKLRLAMKG